MYAFSIVDFNKLNVAKLTAIVFDITKTAHPGLAETETEEIPVYTQQTEGASQVCCMHIGLGLPCTGLRLDTCISISKFIEACRQSSFDSL